MIELTQLNGEKLYVNPDLIEFIAETPDTVISMTTGRKQIVQEDYSVIRDRIVEFRKIVGGGNLFL